MTDYADLVIRLRLKINCEDTLQKWDLVRDDLLKGDMGDGPRMAMESWLDEGDEQRDEAADAIEALMESLADCEGGRKRWAEQCLAAEAKVEALVKERDSLETSATHSCHDNCPRIACVLGRRARAAEAEVTALKAELEKFR